MLSGLAIQSISVPLGSNVGSNNGRRVFASRNLRERRPQVSLLREVGTVRNTRRFKEQCAAVSDVADAKDTVIEEGNSSVVLTYLEGNSWQIEVDGVSILIDPIIGSPLDFNIPWLYSAYKYVTRSMTVEDLPQPDTLLITQSLDDHCHLKTLIPLSKLQPELPVIATPNAEPLLRDLFKNVTYIEPGQSTTIKGKNGEVIVKATAGPILGPPWQRPENGYILRSSKSTASVYLEPHCVPSVDLSSEAPVDVVITPVVKQELPAFTLVSGQEDAVDIARKLKAKFVVPMANAELDASGVLSVLVKPSGTNASFQELLDKECPGTRFLIPEPNKPLEILL